MRPNYIRDRKGETKLEAEFTVSARSMGHVYRKIKDRIYTKRSPKNQACDPYIDPRKDFDGYFCVKNGKTWLLEFKYNDGPTKKHQYEAADIINQVNDSHRFVRRTIRENLDKKGSIEIMHYVYRYVNGKKTKLAEFGKSVDEMIKWFEEQ